MKFLCAGMGKAVGDIPIFQHGAFLDDADAEGGAAKRTDGFFGVVKDLFPEAVVAVGREDGQVVEFENAVFLFGERGVADQGISRKQAKHLPAPFHLGFQVAQRHEGGVLGAIFGS